MAAIENQAKRDAARIVRDIEADAQREGTKRARKIVTLAIQRIASEQTSESVVSVLHLPGDEMKGRIIGREGRNIRAFESVTGVNLIIDDTPEAVLLSCFDPVRREVGRLTLERLVLDGRIHPQRIEEAYDRSKAEIEALCVRAGEDALIEVGITDMHPELTNLLGRLRYRTSYGQNVLKHLIESAHIAGMMASELGMDTVLLKRCTLLHDIGDYLAPANHSEVAAAMLRPYVSEKNYWIVKHHGVFQGYYYFHHVGMDRNIRDRWRDDEHYQATVDFCANYDQNSFDPDYDSEPLSFFEPMVRRVLDESRRHDL